MTQSKQLGWRLCLPGVVFLLGMTACATTTTPKNAPSWDAFVAQFIDGYFEHQPPDGAQAGRHEFDGRLPDWRPSGLLEQRDWLKRQRAIAEQFPNRALTKGQPFEREHLIAVIRRKLFWLEVADSPAKNPMFYSGSLDPNMYVNRPYAPIDQRLRAFIRYARNIPEACRQIRANLNPPLPRSYIDVGKTVFSGLAKFYAVDAKAAFNEVSDPLLQSEFAETQQQASKAMSELAEWLESLRATATDDFALGGEVFREMLEQTEGVAVPLDQLQQLGERDMKRNTQALRQECSHYAPTASLADCVGRVESRKPADGAVAEARRQLVALKSFVEREGLVTIPGTENADVAESPAYKRWNTAYIDIPGPYERSLPAIYYVAPPDPSWSPADQAAYVPSKANLLFISAHEVWPGHFLQHLHAHHAGSKFAQVFSSYAFSEGWAHYSEELMWEAGLNAGDAETHIGQLLNALIRDVRFLSAIGLHTQGMTLAQSEQMFRDLAFRDAGSARQQAARGTFDPGYLNYTLGKLMIRKLREDWTAGRGGRQAWRAFHDAFLSRGAPPIPLVRRAMIPGDAGSAL